MPSPMDQEIIAGLLKVLPTFEGNIPWPYLDTAGNVTVGIGHLIPDIDAMVAIPWVIVYTDTPADESMVRSSWDAVRVHEKGQSASFYAPFTRIRVPPGWAESDASGRLESNYLPPLMKDIPGYSGYPLPAQVAILDLAYNVGERSVEHWRLIASCEAGDWATAATQCHRKPPISQSRNDWAKAQFMSCANTHQGEQS
jgi:GH24 family phage-related lysozyme (muramidase)